MNGYCDINIDRIILGALATKGTYWMNDFCLEREDITKDGITTLYFRFGDLDETEENHTDNFDISRVDARNFIVCYLADKWGIDTEYHMDSLYFSSDGDEHDCVYVIRAEVFKED